MLSLVLALATTAWADPLDPLDYTSLDTTLQATAGSTVFIESDTPVMAADVGYFGAISPEGAAVFTFDEVDLANVTFETEGARPIVILSHGAIVFDSVTWRSDGNDRTGGAGGYDGAATFDSVGEGPGGGESGLGGGAGGGHGSAGADASGGALGGSAYGDLRSTLQGGSGGGADTSIGAGGGGGGALELGALGGLSILGGSISLDGSEADTWGGGGAGGGLFVHSEGTLTVTGTLGALGAAGSTASGDGGDGRIVLAANSRNITGTIDIGDGVYTSTNDMDGDGTRDNQDCDPYDPTTADDDDGDGLCDDDPADACFGDDTTGDTDANGVCDDEDPCPAVGLTDADLDTICDPDESELGWDRVTLYDGSSSQWSAPHPVDVDGDGDLDLVAANRSEDGVYWWENVGVLYADEQTLLDVSHGPRHLCVGDVDGDGDVDLVTPGYETGEVFLHLAIGSTGTYEAAVLLGDVGDDARGCVIEDFFGDGFPEVTYSSFSGASYGYFDNDAGTFSAAIALGTHSAFTAEAYDVDSDGLMDVVSSSNGSIRWNRNLGTGFDTAQSMGGGNIRGFTLADFDQDGLLDLAQGANSTTDPQVWSNDGTSPRGTLVLEVPALGEETVLTHGDLDGDDHVDLLWRDTQQGLLIQEGSATGITLTQIAAGTDLTANDAATLDVDGDGDVDIVSFGNDGVFWLVNPDASPCTGDPTTGDLDGDGICGDVDLCTGDDATGDTDADGVCDDADTCTGDDALGDSDGDGVCEDLDLCLNDDAFGDADGNGICDIDLAVTDPMTAGAPFALTVQNAGPSSSVFFFVSARTGAGPCAPGTTTCFDIVNPTMLARITASTDGLASFAGVVPSRFAGRTVHFQAVWFDGATGDIQTSSVVTRDIP